MLHVRRAHTYTCRCCSKGQPLLKQARLDPAVPKSCLSSVYHECGHGNVLFSCAVQNTMLSLPGLGEDIPRCTGLSWQSPQCPGRALQWVGKLVWLVPCGFALCLPIGPCTQGQIFPALMEAAPTELVLLDSGRTAGSSHHQFNIH